MIEMNNNIVCNIGVYIIFRDIIKIIYENKLNSKYNV